jgi:hypothetical protein
VLDSETGGWNGLPLSKLMPPVSHTYFLQEEQQVSQRFPVMLLCLLEKFKGGFRDRTQARN